MVTITASAKALSARSDGSYNWDNGVTVTGYAANGSIGKVVYSSEFRDSGIGVAGPGSRWSQIDYIRTDGSRGPDGNGVAGGSSEALVIKFQTPVKDVKFSVGMMGSQEGKLDGNKVLPETGKWTAYDSADKIIGTGKIGPDFSLLGSGQKVPGSYGEYPFAVKVGTPIASLRIEATEFGYGRTSKPGFFKENDSSDFSLSSITFESGTLLQPAVIKKPINVDAGDDVGSSGSARTGTNGSDRLVGTDGGDRLFGLRGSDTMGGGAGDDYLDGGQGRDVLNGGTGDDTLLGGGGKDTFVFSDNFGNDVVLDFSSLDTLHIEVGAALAAHVGRSSSLEISGGVVMADGDEVRTLSSILQSYGKSGVDSYQSGSNLTFEFGPNSSVTLFDYI